MQQCCSGGSLDQIFWGYPPDFRSKHSFELVTLDDQLTCDTNSRDEMLEHLVYILKVRKGFEGPGPESSCCLHCLICFPFQVILPAGVSYAEVCSGIAVCKVCVVGEGGASNPSDAWLLLWEDGISIHPVNKQAQPALMMELSMLNVPGNACSCSGFSVIDLYRSFWELHFVSSFSGGSIW